MPHSLRAWYRRNGKWVIVMLVVSLIGAGIVLVLRSVYEYQSSHYEPKDIPRGEQLEKKLQRQQQ
jgi:predicted negative regulator of RcsB-dependent stress response